MATPYRILAKKRAGLPLDAAELGAVARGAADGSWSDGQLGAFLMAAAIRGLDAAETRALTVAMLESGERWRLADEVPGLVDKHSTGGVGDKVSLVLAPLLAACEVPVAMLAGRGLGHTAGTIDKLEAIPGVDLTLDRRRTLELLAGCGVAVGAATAAVAPADRRLYALRDVTATVDALPLMVASILSKKLALGAAGVVFDVKTGNGAFLPGLEAAQELARLLVETSEALGTPAAALLTDMSQPLGRWAGHAAEVMEALDCLSGEGPEDLREVTFAQCEEVARLVGRPVGRAELEAAIASGRARERFDRWVELQGAEAGWEERVRAALAPHVVPVPSPRGGVLAAIDTRQLGLLLAEAGGGRVVPGSTIDHGVALESLKKIGERVEEGADLARLHLRRTDPALAARFADCYTVAEAAAALPLLLGRS
ncbi:MAG TPA: thymidine phosphorylase [Thermoanaerobaculia bacterium]|nr:thymidine phosphorylase [Thermoanaerobaculia bacterium]